MKYLILILTLICVVNLSHSQGRLNKQDTFDLNKAITRLEYGKRDFNYSLKFDEKLKPYIEIHFLNNLPAKKTITTFLFEFAYEVQGVNYVCNKTIQRVVRPGNATRINIIFNDEELKSYGRPSDIRILDDKFFFTVKSIRFADGTISEIPILITAK
jgi:hypothetical protein